MDSSKQALIASTLGMIAGGIFFSMNTTLNYIAIPCYMFAQEHLQHHQQSGALILHQWKETFWRGHTVGPGLAIFQGLAYLYAAYQVGFSTTRSRLYLASAVCTAGIIPYTLIVMLATNEKLLRKADEVIEESRKEMLDDDDDDDDDDEGGGSDDAGVAQMREVYRLLHRWTDMSKTRAVMPLFAIGCALYALTL